MVTQQRCLLERMVTKLLEGDRFSHLIFKGPLGLLINHLTFLLLYKQSRPIQAVWKITPPLPRINFDFVFNLLTICKSINAFFSVQAFLSKLLMPISRFLTLSTTIKTCLIGRVRSFLFTNLSIQVILPNYAIGKENRIIFLRLVNNSERKLERR